MLVKSTTKQFEYRLGSQRRIKKHQFMNSFLSVLCYFQMAWDEIDMLIFRSNDSCPEIDILQSKNETYLVKPCRMQIRSDD